MQITIQDIEQIALTAQLELTAEEKQRQLEKFNKLFQDVEVLAQVDTSEIEPLAHVQSIKNVLREDLLQESLSQEKVLQNAPDQEEGMFKVPKII